MMKLDLELLEDRLQPGPFFPPPFQPPPPVPVQTSPFLSLGVVTNPAIIAQLTPPLVAMLSDMQSASIDLNTQFNTMAALGPLSPTTTPAMQATAQVAFGRAVGDWARLLVDDHAINIVAVADVNFIQAAAFAEAQRGFPIDAIILSFGSSFGLNPLAPFAAAVIQANTIISNPTTQFEVTTNLATITPLVAQVRIIDEVFVTF